MASEEAEYTVPDDYENLDEVAAPSPIENPREQPLYRHESLEERRSHSRGYSSERYKRSDDLERRQSKEVQKKRRLSEGQYAGLTEIAAPPPVEREDELPAAEDELSPPSSSKSAVDEARKTPAPKREKASKIATQLYTISHLIFWSLMGTLARLGLQALTFYPGAPVQTGVLWANFGGTFVMGFLSEDRSLFRGALGPTTPSNYEKSSKPSDEENAESNADRVAEGKAHAAAKKTIPLYIGLATGFCGSFTSFSSFMRDVFFALSNSLPVPVSHTSTGTIDTSSTVSRNGGYSFMAVVAVILLTVVLCIGALQGGAHFAILLDPLMPTIPLRVVRRLIDRSMVFLGWGCWLGAIFLAVWPPDRPSGPDSHRSWVQETWRGQAIYSLCFAPLGCLLRFYASLKLNGKIPSFPLGTFFVNIFGTVMLGMFYDLQHAPLGAGVIGGGRVGCQVLQGFMDGFCGCLTTVSTWVAELKGLRRRHAYIYGGMSVGVALAFLVIIMGRLKWTIGCGTPACVT